MTRAGKIVDPGAIVQAIQPVICIEVFTGSVFRCLHFTMRLGFKRLIRPL